MGTPDTWTDDTADWTTASDWSTGAVPGAGDVAAVGFEGGDPQVTTNVGTVASLTDQGEVDVLSGGTLAVTGNLSPTDNEGGNGGILVVDASGGTANATLTVGGALVDSVQPPTSLEPELVVFNELSLTGGTSSQAALTFTTAAAGIGGAGIIGDNDGLGGIATNISLTGNAQILFASGTISTISDGAALSLTGAAASIAIAGGGINSALSGLTTVGGSFATAQLLLAGGATITTTGGVTNNALISVDGTNGVGGSSLNIGGVLTNAASGSFEAGSGTAATTVTATGLSNAGTIFLNGAEAVPVTFIVSGAAGFGTTGTLSGDVTLAGDASLQFVSGQIATIAANSDLSLSGPNASVLDGGGGVNSALTGLSSVAAAGALDLHDGATLRTGALDNAGTINLDQGSIFEGSPVPDTGGSSLAVDGVLTNSGSIAISGTVSSDVISGSDQLSATSLSNTGSLTVGPGGSLNVAGAAGFGTTGVLTGTVSVINDPNAGTNDVSGTIQFASGMVSTIAAGGSLVLAGPGASIADAGGAADSAISGLSTNDGSLAVVDGASLTTTGALSNVGTILVGSEGEASTTLSIDSQAGFGTSGAVTGSVEVSGEGTIEFAGGQISSIAAGATLSLEGDASIADAGGGSALGGLTTINGTLALVDKTLDTGSLTFAPSGTYQEELGGATLGVINATGTVSLGGATLNASLESGFTPTTGQSFSLIDSTGAINGTFAGLAQGATVDIGGDAFTINYAGGDGDDVVLTDVGPVCFVTGTRIRTLRGDVAVEDLVIGDRAVTVSGATRPVVWIGHRDLGCGAGAHAIRPVRVAAEAFGPGLPARRLMLSPGHPVLVGADEDGSGGHLVPIMCLINGTTIDRVPVDEVTYWHVELDAHDILLAEGLPAESYLDWGDRTFFTEGADHGLANPDFVVPGLSARCRPVMIDGPLIDAERSRLDVVFTRRLASACAWPTEDAQARAFA